MLICEYAATDAAEVRRIGARSQDAELYLRDDAKGSLIICSAGTAAEGGAVKAVEILFTGGEVGARGGDWLFYVGVWTPPDFRDEFLAWYKLEHLPILLECPAWDGCRLVEQKVDGGCQFFAIHQLSERSALDSAERKRSRATPWFLRLAKQNWFDGPFTRMLCKRVAAR